MVKLAKNFRSFADLAAAYERDRDYRIVRLLRPESEVAILAPHGGSIEAHTSDIARDIAGRDFNLYLFEGLLKAGNFAALHLSSHLFDEPHCLDLLGACQSVISVHGCCHAGEVVLMGGRDAALRESIGARLHGLGVDCGRRASRARRGGFHERLQSRAQRGGRAIGDVACVAAVAAPSPVGARRSRGAAGDSGLMGSDDGTAAGH